MGIEMPSPRQPCPVPNGVCARKPWSFSSACKNLSRQRPLRAEISYSQKVDLGGPESACSAVLLVDQSSPDFFHRTREESLSSCLSDLDISIRSGDIRDRTLKWSEIDQNFARFWPPTFWGEGPKILGPGLSNTRTFRSYGKVSGRSADGARRSRVETKKKETSAVKHKSTWNYRSGWPNQHWCAGYRI